MDIAFIDSLVDFCWNSAAARC